MIVLCCGSRFWNDWKAIESFFDGLAPDTIIVHGDSKGADKMCGYVGNKRGFKVIAESAKWKFGLYAGPIRNSAMIHIYEPNLVVAFHNNIQNSKGTKNMIYQAKLCKIPVKIIKSDDACQQKL